MPATQKTRLHQGSSAAPARIILVTSIMHFCCGRLKRSDAPSDWGDSVSAYSQSKLAQVHLPQTKAMAPLRSSHAGKHIQVVNMILQVVFAAELRRRLPEDGSIAAFACHPGECTTHIGRTLPGWMQSLYWLLLPPLLLTPTYGESVLPKST